MLRMEAGQLLAADGSVIVRRSANGLTFERLDAQGRPRFAFTTRNLFKTVWIIDKQAPTDCPVIAILIITGTITDVSDGPTSLCLIGQQLCFDKTEERAAC